MYFVIKMINNNCAVIRPIFANIADQSVRKDVEMKINENEGIKNPRDTEDSIVYPFKPTDPEEVDSCGLSSSTESELESVNSAKDNPFLSTIGGHKFRDDGAILFRCHDTDDDNESWCNSNKAITNVGKKVFEKYVNSKNLKKKTYTPQSIKPASKKDLRRLANINKAKQDVKKVMLKIVERRKAKNGDMYKVLTEDLKHTWETIESIGPEFCQLMNEYNQKQSSSTIDAEETESQKKNLDKTSKETAPKRSQNSQKRKNESTQDTAKNKSTKRKGTKKRTEPYKEKPFVCRLNHKQYQTYKAESDKKWFEEKQRFGNSMCFICKKNIQSTKTDHNFVPSSAKPAYICVNSTKNCKKCLCHYCCVKLMINDTTTDKSNRRSRRNRS